jgi:hypothetical protein
MKLWAKFIYGTGEQGENGFILAKQPNFDPASQGSTFAHDALDHMPDGQHGDEGMANELLALGSMMYARGQARAFDQPPGIVLGQELAYHVGTCYFNLAQPRYRIPRLRNEQVELWIGEAIRITRNAAHEEWTDWCEQDEERLEHTLEDMACWLRIGYHRGKRRYCGGSPYNLAALHRKLAQDFEALCTRKGYISYGIPGDHGDQLRLWLDPKTLDSHLELVRAEDLYQ